MGKMKQKALVIALLLMVGVVGTFYVPIVSSDAYEEISDKIYLEDVNVLVVGRCRTIVSDGSWHGGLFIGKMAGASLHSLDTPLERLHILVYNESYTNLLSRIKLGVVHMLNIDGIFFWSQIGNGVSKIPPLAFVFCHAENVWIDIIY